MIKFDDRQLLFLLVFFQPIFLQADEKLPQVPDGFKVSVFAQEPFVRNPCAMTFDVKGRLFVSQGVQYRNPRPDTPGDRITILMDQDQDGRADTSKTFADGFNHIQGLAWRGDELWVANAPELTVVRDLDGDDIADEYKIIYGGLGNLEHALHGLNFAPDGRLYMSKGNSKGYVNQDSPEKYLAPKPFTDLWGVKYPADQPELPEPIISDRAGYQKGYHQPSDDWGTEGGILRCDPDGKNLQIVSRGQRNVWDMSYDDRFNWLATDQDQDDGDRVISPFYGSHFGWGHPWSAHWSGKDHLPTVPISGPLFNGSGTGVIYNSSAAFPEKYRNVFYFNDWLNRKILLYRPRWEGALMSNRDELEVFAAAEKGRTLGSSSGMVFDPTDIEIGPDGALWVLSWGHHYGATIQNGKQTDEGRVYRTYPENFAAKPNNKKYNQAYKDWSVRALMDDLSHDALPVRRTNAQIELVRRGSSVKQTLIDHLKQNLSAGGKTWTAWTLAQIDLKDSAITQLFLKQAFSDNLDDRIQAIRILAFRAQQTSTILPAALLKNLSDPEARIRFATVQAIHESKQISHLDSLWKASEPEQDRVTFYAIWQALSELENPEKLKAQLKTSQPGVRRAALLALLENVALSGDEAKEFILDEDRYIAELAASFVEKVGTSSKPVLQVLPKEESFAGSLQVRMLIGDVKGLKVRYTINGSEPTDTNARDYQSPIPIQADTLVQAALFRGRLRVGPVIKKRYRKNGNQMQITSTGPLAADLVKNIRTKSNSQYQLQTLSLGEKVYTNRPYSWNKIPAALLSKSFLQTSNADADVGSTSDSFLEFELTEEMIVYVGHDQRIGSKPAWLKDFTQTEMTLSSQDATFTLYQKRFPIGKVTLGGNTTDGNPSKISHYTVIFQEAPLRTREKSITALEILAMMRSANPQRGERLFFSQANCGKCHRIGTRGNAYAPNLTNIGYRATPKILAQSILEPSAVITEGFHGISVITAQGKTVTGFIKQESGLALELIQQDGKPITVLKSDIEERVRLPKSMMPLGYDKLLTPRQAADLIAFIMAIAKQPTETKNKPPSLTDSSLHQITAGQSWGNQEEAFFVKEKESALEIYLDGQPIASYFFRDQRINRPFFAHVKTSSGIQVTRNFPPVQGKDLTDHALLHPGMWLGFAILDGSNFWHENQGKVQFAGFFQTPTAGEQVTFGIQQKYLTKAGDLICTEQVSYKIVRDPDGYRIDLESKIFSDQPFYFGVREEMGFGIRIATDLTVKKGTGAILNSFGGKDEKGTWGKVASWWNYFGNLQNETVGIMLMSHQDNRPIWSHSRDYGALVANPFPVDRKENKQIKTIIKPGEAFHLRLGILIHHHKTADSFDRAAAYKRYTDASKK